MASEIREDLEVFISCAVESSRQVQLFDELYGDDANVALLNDMPNTFAIVKLALLKTIVIGICAFFDPKKTRSDENLSLAYLEDKYQGRMTCEIAEIIKSARDLYDALKIAKYRSKYLAHYDLLHFTKVEKISHDITTEDLQSLLVMLMSIGLKLSGNQTTAQHVFDMSRLDKADSGKSIIGMLAVNRHTKEPGRI